VISPWGFFSQLGMEGSKPMPMRDLIACLLTFLVIAGLIVTWRQAVIRRRRDCHSIRFRLVSDANDPGLGG
jgi:hypothetical protein